MQAFLFEPMSRDDRQKLALRKWIENGCKGTLVASTGFGKTRVGLNAIQLILKKYPQKRVLVIVPTTALKEQWAGIIDQNGLSLNCEVMVVNTAIKQYPICDVLILDEVHRFGADTFSHIFKCADYKFVLGLTATFERVDGKHEILNKYCPVFDEVSLEEAKFQGWISDYKEYQILINVDDYEDYKRINREFQEHFDFFGFDFNLAQKCAGPTGWQGQIELRDRMCGSRATPEQKKATLKAIKYHAARFYACLSQRKAFINNHPKKIEIARKIIEARPFSKIITFSNNIKMAESIGMGGKVFSGKDSKKKGRTTIEEFSKEPYGLLNTIRKADEGLDVPGLSVAIILGLDSSKTRKIQRIGRVARKEGDKQAEIFTIVINNTVETQWFKNSNSSTSVITIDEKGLDDLLEGKEPEPYKKKINDFTFRF